MTNFKLPKPRFDRKIANEGREIPVYDEMGTYNGTFRLALVDSTLPRYRIAFERLARKYNAGNRPKGNPAELNHQIAVEVIVELALLDWKDVFDGDGNPVPFSKEKAIELLAIHEVDNETGEKYFPMAWLVKRLTEEAENLHNFQPDDQVELPEKN